MMLLSQYVARWEYELLREQECSRAEETRQLRLSRADGEPGQADADKQRLRTALRRLALSLGHAGS
jgi:hypothetical protein